LQGVCAENKTLGLKLNLNDITVLIISESGIISAVDGICIVCKVFHDNTVIDGVIEHILLSRHAVGKVCQVIECEPGFTCGGIAVECGIICVSVAGKGKGVLCKIVTLTVLGNGKSHAADLAAGKICLEQDISVAEQYTLFQVGVLGDKQIIKAGIKYVKVRAGGGDRCNICFNNGINIRLGGDGIELFNKVACRKAGGFHRTIAKQPAKKQEEKDRADSCCAESYVQLFRIDDPIRCRVYKIVAILLCKIRNGAEEAGCTA